LRPILFPLTTITTSIGHAWRSSAALFFIFQRKIEQKKSSHRERSLGNGKVSNIQSLDPKAGRNADIFGTKKQLAFIFAKGERKS